MTTTGKTEARPSRSGSSSSQLTLEVFSGVGGSGRRPVSPPTPRGVRRGGQEARDRWSNTGKVEEESVQKVGFRGCGGWGLGSTKGSKWPGRRSPRRRECVTLADWKSKVSRKENIGFRGAQGTAPGTPGGGLRAPGTSFGRPRAQPGRSGDTVLKKNHPWGYFWTHFGVVCDNF